MQDHELSARICHVLYRSPNVQQVLLTSLPQGGNVLTPDALAIGQKIHERVKNLKVLIHCVRVHHDTAIVSNSSQPAFGSIH